MKRLHGNIQHLTLQAMRLQALTEAMAIICSDIILNTVTRLRFQELNRLVDKTLEALMAIDMLAGMQL